MLVGLFKALGRLAISAESLADKFETADAGIDQVFGKPDQLVEGGVVPPRVITQQDLASAESSVAVIEPDESPRPRRPAKRKAVRKKKVSRQRR